MSKLRIQFGRKLKAIRKEREVTQEKFAETIEISVDFLSLIERGKFSPSFDKLETIALNLGLQVKDLFDFPPEPTKLLLKPKYSRKKMLRTP